MVARPGDAAGWWRHSSGPWPRPPAPDCSCRPCSAPASRARRRGRPSSAHVYPDGGMIGFGSVSLSDPHVAPAAQLAGLLRRGDPRRERLPAGQCGRRRLRLRRRDLRGVRGRPAAARSDRGHGDHADAKGYWLGALDGGVFAYGDAPFYGSMGSTHLNQPIVGMAATPDGKGYWLVAADGGIFAYGDAGFYGSTGSLRAQRAHRGHGADARRQGLLARRRRRRHLHLRRRRASTASAGSENLPDPVVGMVASPDGGGYLMATANGVVLPFGDAQAFGGPLAGPHGDPDLGHHRQQPRDGATGCSTRRPGSTASRLRLPSRCSRSRRRSPPPWPRRSSPIPTRPGRVLQSVRALRAVVRAVRHLGLGAGRHPDPALRLHRRHLGLGRHLRRRPAADRHAGRRRRRPLRDRAPEHLDVGARRDRHPGLARRRHHDGRR